MLLDSFVLFITIMCVVNVNIFEHVVCITHGHSNRNRRKSGWVFMVACIVSLYKISETVLFIHSSLCSEAALPQCFAPVG